MPAAEYVTELSIMEFTTGMKGWQNVWVDNIVVIS